MSDEPPKLDYQTPDRRADDRLSATRLLLGAVSFIFCLLLLAGSLTILTDDVRPKIVQLGLSLCALAGAFRAWRRT